MALLAFLALGCTIRSGQTFGIFFLNDETWKSHALHWKRWEMGNFWAIHWWKHRIWSTVQKLPLGIIRCGQFFHHWAFRKARVPYYTLKPPIFYIIPGFPHFTWQKMSEKSRLRVCRFGKFCRQKNCWENNEVGNGTISLRCALTSHSVPSGFSSTVHSSVGVDKTAFLRTRIDSIAKLTLVNFSPVFRREVWKHFAN